MSSGNTTTNTTQTDSSPTPPNPAATVDLDLAFAADGAFAPELLQAAGPWADPLDGAACWHGLLEQWRLGVRLSFEDAHCRDAVAVDRHGHQTVAWDRVSLLLETSWFPPADEHVLPCRTVHGPLLEDRAEVLSAEEFLSTGQRLRE